jgi:multiple sugar transport system permease protein
MSSQLQAKPAGRPSKSIEPSSKTAGGYGYNERRRVPWAFILPAVVPLALITIGPLLFLYGISMTNYDLGTQLSDARFVGLANYIRLFSGRDPEFVTAVRNTLILGFVATSAELVLGLFVALLLDSLERWRGTLIALLLLPMVVTPVIVGLIWKLMLNASNGVINWLLAPLGVAPTWLGPNLSLLSVLMVEIWQWTPFVALILLSGLSSLPMEPHEAAAIDGAGPWQTLFLVTLPLLKPIIVVAVLFRLIDVLKIFDIVFIMTGGGPGASTETLSIHAYRLGFLQTGWVGRASATAVVLALLTTVVTSFVVGRLQQTNQER